MSRTLKSAADATTEGQETAPESAALVAPAEETSAPVEALPPIDFNAPLEGHASDEDPADAPPPVAAADAPIQVQTLKRGEVRAISHIKRAAGNVASGDVFTPADKEERKFLLECGAVTLD